VSGPAAHRRVRRYRDGAWSDESRAIPEEAPVTFAPNGAPFAAVMASPADLKDLARGFAVTEGLVERAEDIFAIDIVPMDEGYEARLDIPAASAAALADRRRAFAARTSCSLCGLEDLDMLLGAPPRPAPSGAPSFRPDMLLAAMAALPGAQRLNAASHGLHAAGWIDGAGDLAFVREDVGRHNALDKLVGALLAQDRDPADGAICLTSRCSIEMVLKAARVGAGLIAAASSPTELAVRAATAAGIALVAGLREDAFDVYACPEKLELTAA